MKLKCNWTILHRYIFEPSLNPFKAHIELQMSSYVNVKAIKLIALFVGFVQVYKAPGILPGVSIEWLAYHQKVVQFCNQTSIFCSGNKTLAYVSWVATRAPIIKT